MIPKDAPLLNLTWDYDYDEPPRLPDGTLSRIEGEPDGQQSSCRKSTASTSTKLIRATGKPKLLSGFSECKDDGSTACGCWIYSGVFPEPDATAPANAKATTATRFIRIGALPGRTTGAFCTTGRARTRREIPGRSAKNISGGTKEEEMGGQ